MSIAAFAETGAGIEFLERILIVPQFPNLGAPAPLCHPGTTILEGTGLDYACHLKVARHTRAKGAEVASSEWATVRGIDRLSPALQAEYGQCMSRVRLMAQRYVSDEIAVRSKMLSKAGLWLASLERSYRQGPDAFKRPSKNDDQKQLVLDI